MKHFFLTTSILVAAALSPVGCATSPGGVDDQGAAVVAAAEPITFSHQVVRLLQEHCQSCHHPGGHGPFSLMTYGQARPFANAIKNAVVSGRMPEGPSVRLDTGCSDKDRFDGPRRLTAEETAVFAGWAEAGAPEGDRTQLPPERVFEKGAWVAGQPDFELANSASGFVVPPRLGRDIFRRFVIPTDFESDRFLTGFEGRPGTTEGAGITRIVHHITLFIDAERKTLEQERRFAASNPEVPGPGFEGEWETATPPSLVGMWFPGGAPQMLPSGLGVRVPRGAAIVMEVHYANSAEAITDRSLVGLHFADGPITSEVTTSLVKNEQFTIPAAASRFEVEGTRTFPAAVTLRSITPHMHQLGTDFTITVERPGDAASCLADVQWDFEHQGTYWLREPLVLPAGTTIRTSCLYDNSTANPHQFNHPPQAVDFGRTADHEMCQLTVATTAVARQESCRSCQGPRCP